MCKNRMALVWVSLIVGLLCQACKEEEPLPTNPNTQPISSLSEAIVRWQSTNIHTYSMKQTTNSWYGWSGDTVIVNIKADTIADVFSIRSNSKLDYSAWIQYKTVNQLFDIAQLDTNTHTLSYEFNQAYGFPSNIYFSIKPPPITEGGIRYTSFDFKSE